jgi:Leucine-rich repeat (LRR) protein
MSTTRSKEFELVSQRIRLQSSAASKNQASISDVAGLHTKATAAKAGLAGSKLTSINFDRLKADYNTFQSTQSMAVNEENQKEEEAAVASGELNPYQKYYIDAMAGGSGIVMNLPPSAFSGTPELTEFPKEICEFTNAKQVIILKNKIASIPAAISKMTSLKKLDLSGNMLRVLPSEIGALANLETLKLSNNPLERLPAELTNCSKLKTLVLKGTKVSAEDVATLQAKLPNLKIKI